MRNGIVLIGMMGSGKTAVGKAVARRLAWEFIDLDEVITNRAQRSISEVFDESGEECFRELESEALESLLAGDAPAVLATGGGTPMRERNFELLQQLGKVVYLRAEPPPLIARLEGETAHRPLLSGGLRERVEQLLREREPAYRKAHFTVNADGEVEDVAAQVIRAVGVAAHE
ncbi:MAG: Shikimate kinase [Fimbriimonadales bacterium]|nr:MAG: shikimate kinase [Armatimonadota bacterium]MBV6503378.1 Shikimate kinase [Fimbriimonadales bacterium]MCE7900377.1 shikimate kinase [Armatimonadetes bacterium ATM1]MDL1928267.1 shikimate kinase [Fimbriimonadia bacterium ATM]MBC6969179.1 shikimate kinase [Armatimonadota bacterium]